MRAYRLEGEHRDTLLDTIREGFAALGIGQTADWIDAMAREDEAA